MYRGHAQSTVEGHSRGGKGICPTRTTTQRFYRPMPLLMLYLVLSLGSSSFSQGRQLFTDLLIAHARAHAMLLREFILQKVLLLYSTVLSSTDTFFEVYCMSELASVECHILPKMCFAVLDPGLPMNCQHAKFHSFCNCSFQMTNSYLDCCTLNLHVCMAVEKNAKL